MLLFTMSFYHKKQSTLWAEFIINSNECEPIFQVLFLRILCFFFRCLFWPTACSI